MMATLCQRKTFPCKSISSLYSVTTGRVIREYNRGCKGQMTIQRKNAQMTRFPEYLIISLERVSKRNGQRLNRQVTLPITLGLSCRGQSDVMYSLNSAVIHCGDLRDGQNSTLVRVVINGKPDPKDLWVLLKNEVIIKGIEVGVVHDMLIHHSCLLMYKQITDPKKKNAQLPVQEECATTSNVVFDEEDEDDGNVFEPDREDGDEDEELYYGKLNVHQERINRLQDELDELEEAKNRRLIEHYRQEEIAAGAKMQQRLRERDVQRMKDNVGTGKLSHTTVLPNSREDRGGSTVSHASTATSCQDTSTVSPN